MGSIAAAKPDMGALSQKRLILSPFGALVRAFSEDLLARNGFEEGLWPFIPLEFLEEGKTVPQPPVPPIVQMDLKLVLQALRQTGSHTRQEQITERIVERIIRLQEGKGPRPDRNRSAARRSSAGSGQAETAHSAPAKGQGMAGEARAIRQISVLRQNFYDTVNQRICFTANLMQTVNLSYPFQAREHVFPKLSASAENRAGGIPAAALPAPAAPTAGTRVTLPAMPAASIPELPGRGRKGTGVRPPDSREVLEELSYPDSGEGAAGAKEPGTGQVFTLRGIVAGRLTREFTALTDGRNARGQTLPSFGSAPGRPAASTAGRAGGRVTAEAHRRAEERRETHNSAGDAPRQTHARQEGTVYRPQPEARPGWERVSEPETAAAGEPDGPDTDHPSRRRQLRSPQKFGGMSLEEKLTAASVQDIRITGAGRIAPEREENHAAAIDIKAAIPSTDSAELTYRTAPEGSERPGTTPGIADTSSQSAPRSRDGARNYSEAGKQTGVPESRSEAGNRVARIRTADRADGKTSGSSIPREALRLPAAPGENAAGGGPVGRSAAGVSAGDTQNRQPEGRAPLASRRDVSGARWGGRHKEGARAPGLTPASDGAERRLFAAVPRDIRLFRAEPRAGTAQELQGTGDMAGGLFWEEIVYLTRDPAEDTAAGLPGQSAVRAAGTGQAARPPLPAGGAMTGQTYGRPEEASSDLRGAAAFGGSERAAPDLAAAVSGGQPDEASLGAISAGRFDRAPLSLTGAGPVGRTISPGFADGPEAMPELAYAGQGRNANRDMGTRPQEQRSRQGGTGSDDARVLPDWARRFLLDGGPQGLTGAPGKTGPAKGAAAPPVATPREVISRTAPDYRPPSSIAFKERREPQQTPQNIRISDAEIRRTAEKVYRIIEERIRRERRRLGL